MTLDGTTLDDMWTRKMVTMQAPRGPREWRIHLPLPDGRRDLWGDDQDRDQLAGRLAPAGWYCVGTIGISRPDATCEPTWTGWSVRVTYWPEAWRATTTLLTAPAVYAAAQIAGLPTRLDRTLVADHDGIQYLTPDGRPNSLDRQLGRTATAQDVVALLTEERWCSGDGYDGGDSGCGSEHGRDDADRVSHACGGCARYTPGAQCTEGLCPSCWRDEHPDGPEPVGEADAGWVEEEYTVVEAADCDGGRQVVRIEVGEDCCAAARRAGGICLHGADGLRPLGDGASRAQCAAAIERLDEDEAVAARALARIDGGAK